MTITQAYPKLFVATGAKKIYSANSSNWVDPAGLPQVTGSFYHDTSDNSWRDMPKGGRDIGSNWTLESQSVEPGPVIKVLCYASSLYQGWRGPVIIAGGNHHIDNVEMMNLITGRATEPQLLADGSTAISRVLPTNPIADLPLAAAEAFNEGLPRIPGFDLFRDRSIDHQRLSGNYLNYEFAVKPLLADMRKFQEASMKAEAIIDDYARNSGKKIRRRYRFTPQVTSSSEVVPNPPTQGQTHIMGPGSEVGIQDRFKPALGGSGGVRTDYKINVVKRWFSGCFTYHLPHGGRDFSSRLAVEEREMRHLYGGISASTAWNLIPFSWAADWITNAGDVIHNVSAFSQDGLVMPWGYIMEESNHDVTRKVVGARVSGLYEVTYGGHTYRQIPEEVSMTLHAVCKRRRKATPYGFGLNTALFTERQWAILSALGLSWNKRV
jgi:hypothetical protein